MLANLDRALFSHIKVMAKEICDWIMERDHPERYPGADPARLRSFLHVLDILETVLTRIEISAYLTLQTVKNLEEGSPQDGATAEFWPIDIEEFLAASLGELCHQLSVGWTALDRNAIQDTRFRILKKTHPKASPISYARHKVSHFAPDQFDTLPIAQQYSITRRPYRIRDGRLEKERAAETLPKVAALVRDSVQDCHAYLVRFREATIG
jgi:hypothetical protein